ncbi:sugar/nucleoside kinase (ribokinase family) [Rhodobium orientis]|uniref:Adenosine kinase n=1 Tax=Rhodobium orientis TaxID=34017 RepID=A0A327JLN0_9HYPH|nr:adenosine kinase [Rhodobium orientis]MBB4301968.1 sugar/nucleoside kinase (ribokinase family) [Rhodobium orientis]MBK5950205.1 adenosine kinase [Rhodobium orientis]RAI27269.1 adenosine kinase [Rhodobium orientis]
MTDTRFDVLGIGNAIYDVLAHVEDDFLVQENLIKGSMRLIETEEAERLYAKMGPAIGISGGCAGNTVSGVASFGGSAAFIGKVAEDELGHAYRHDIRAFGVGFDTPTLVNGSPTARSMILISPDGERTMNTYLGASQELTPADIDRDTVAAAAVTYLEGYLWDPPAAKEAFRTAAAYAHEAGRKVALTLSDSFCVDRFREEFLDLVRTGLVDVLFSNEHEIHALYQTADLATAIAAVRQDAPLTVITLGAKGSMVVSGEETTEVAAAPVDRVVDLTGAGDLYASGFLFGLSRDFDHADCAELGGIAASEVITHVGARPEKSLRDLAAQRGFPIS